MAFFEDKQKDPQLMDWATRLWKALSDSRNLRPPGRGNGDWRRSWPRVFGQLRREVSPEKIEKVLNWYCANLGQDFVPHAWTPQAFRLKFAQILRCFELADVPEEPDQRSKEIAERFLNDYSLPIEVGSALSGIVQKTRERWEEFCKKMADNYLSLRDRDFVNRVFEQHAPVFIENWLIHLHRVYGRHEHYTGPTATLAFSPRSPHFRLSFWHAWSNEYCHNPKAFDPLLEELTKE